MELSRQLAALTEMVKVQGEEVASLKAQLEAERGSRREEGAETERGTGAVVRQLCSLTALMSEHFRALTAAHAEGHKALAVRLDVIEATSASAVGLSSATLGVSARGGGLRRSLASASPLMASAPLNAPAGGASGGK